ncbi:MAG: phage terminase large subunit [Oscillospiraceae bacterium]|nr:phage terminase large subunit [Oscillospiraceae bacterium]
MYANKKNAEKGVLLDFGEANPKQRLFYESRALYTAYGGARGGGKSHAVRVKAVGGALRWPGIKILILRRTYPELQGNHIEPIKTMIPRTLAVYNGTLRVMHFVNGSTIRFGHFRNSSSETEYQGQEYDWIFTDEATQFTEREFRTLGGCLRGVNDIPKRFYLTCNPGGVGHSWVKRLFIDGDFKRNKENPEENENPKDYKFIFATVEDNKHLLEKSPQYLQMLSSLPEHLRRAHRYGDWDAMSGSYFPEFSEAKHVVKAFKIPDAWPRYRAFDYGLDMLACFHIAVDPEGRSYVYRELCKEKLIVQDAAKEMLSMTLPQEKIEATFAPPDMWSTLKDTGKTMAEVFALNGIGLIRASNNRVQGHLQIHELLAERDVPGAREKRPGIVFFENCKNIISDIQAIRADERNPNDCAKEPHDVTHTVDALRYFAVSRVIAGSLNSSPQEDEDPGGYADYNDIMRGGAVMRSYL